VSRLVKFRNTMKHAPTPIEFLEPRIAPATFLVTSLADAGSGSLRDAIADANDSPGADIIVFKKGLTGSIELATGQIDITDTLAIKGPGAAKLAIDGNSASRIFDVLDADGESPLAVSGLSFFAGGAANDNTGGAIHSGESLKVTHCVFKNNSADRDGGAIAVFDGSATAQVSVNITSSIFTGNLNALFGGGAVEIRVDGSAVVKRCTFTGNSSETRAGALDIGVAAGGVARVEGCQFLNNKAPEHGAVHISLKDSKVTIRGNVFSGNQATSSVGGAIAIFGPGGDIIFDRNVVSQNTSFTQGGGLITGQFNSLKISNSRFLDNASQLSGFLNGGGGAIAIFIPQSPGSTAQIIDSIISGNSSTKGGGIFVAEAPLVLKIIGTKIEGNRSTTEGGGIFIDSANTGIDGASVEVVKSTITGNVAANLGGGVFSSGNGAFTIKSSKVTQNAAAAGGGLYLTSTTEVVISGSLFTRNYSDTTGGAISSLSALELRDTKVIGNIAGQFGGGIYSVSSLEAVGCTISGNLAVSGGGVFQQSAAELSLNESKVMGNISNDGKQVVDA
jgi:predicted outer membrane repeat protein